MRCNSRRMELGLRSWSHHVGSGDRAWRARCSFGPRDRKDGPRARPVVEAARGCRCAGARISAAVHKPASHRYGVSHSRNGLLELHAIDGSCVPADSIDGLGRLARLAASVRAPKIAHPPAVPDRPKCCPRTETPNLGIPYRPAMRTWARASASPAAAACSDATRVLLAVQGPPEA